MQWCWEQPWWGEDLQSEHVMKRFKQRGRTVDGVSSHKNKGEKDRILCSVTTDKASVNGF